MNYTTVIFICLLDAVIDSIPASLLPTLESSKDFSSSQSDVDHEFSARLRGHESPIPRFFITTSTSTVTSTVKTVTSTLSTWR